MSNKRGQISTEYLIVVGFVMFLVTSILGVALFYTSNIQDRLKISQLESFADKVISNAEVIYFAGSPSRATITAHLPQGVHSITFQDNEYLVFDIATSSGENTISYKSNVPISGSLQPGEGLKRITLAIGDVGGETTIIISDGLEDE